MTFPRPEEVTAGGLPGRLVVKASVFVLVAVTLLAPTAAQTAYAQEAEASSVRHPEEDRFRNVRQLTFRGQNAEAYFSPDGSRLVFQATRAGDECDQIYTLDISSRSIRPVTEGEGRHTCSYYYYPDGDRILFSSTRQWGDQCPAEPGLAQGYVWPVYPTYDIYAARADGSEVERLTTAFGYDAEATFSPTGERIVFTSMRNGDLDLYTMKPDGTDIRQLTDQLGYDGGAFFSPDGSKIVYRAHHPRDPEAVAEYKSLLKDGLIRPTELQIYVMEADGSNKRQITDNDGVNFAPYWHPSGEKIIFSSNMHDPEGRNFDLFLIDTDGTDLERVTYSEKFDSFPMFGPDGDRLVWGSNRNNAKPGETNLFIADWAEE